MQINKTLMAWILAGFSGLLSLLLFLTSSGVLLSQRTGQEPDSRTQGSREWDLFDASPSVGVKEIPRPDGGKDRIHYSLTPADEEGRRQQEEEEKSNLAREVLKNVIIDGRIVK